MEKRYHRGHEISSASPFVSISFVLVSFSFFFFSSFFLRLRKVSHCRYLKAPRTGSFAEVTLLFYCSVFRQLLSFPLFFFFLFHRLSLRSLCHSLERSRTLSFLLVTFTYLVPLSLAVCIAAAVATAAVVAVAARTVAAGSGCAFPNFGNSNEISGKVNILCVNQIPANIRERARIRGTEQLN